MPVINTNVKALYTQTAMKGTERASSAAMQQLSTGKRINSAKDDAAGLAIATRMTQQIRSLNQAMRNAGDAVSLMQTAEGATSEITNMLQRMRELSIQAINDTNAVEQRGYLDTEFQQLKQEIVRIADTTEWNGFPILNGTSGERVGERPVYKATSAGTFSSAIGFTASAVTPSGNGGASTIGAGNGTISKSGAVTVTVNAGAGTATAVMTLSDGNQISFNGVVAGTTITFTNTPITNGAGTFILNAATPVATATYSFSVSRAFTPVPAMAANDVIINGVTIGVSYAASDNGKSPAGSAAASAIARAATINQNLAETKVAAIVNTNVMTGSAMGTGLDAKSGTVTINGFTSAPITTVLNNTRESRAAVVSAINAISSQTGVVAINSNLDNQGVRLQAADGRNIELMFNTAATTAEFEARTGLKQGLQIGSYSLETSVEGKLEVTTLSTGDWTRAGLKPASYTKNQAVINTGIRPLVSDKANIKALGDGDLVINGVAIRATVAADDTQSNTISATSSASASAIAIANAINSHRTETGVTAQANSVATSGSVTTVAVAGTQSLFINGINVQVALLATDTAPERLAKVVTAVNGSFGQHGAMATNNGTGGITLTTPDGRNLSVWHDNTVPASEFGLMVVSGGSNVNATGVTAIAKATAASTGDGISATTTQGAAAVTVAATTAGVGSSQVQVSTATFAALAFGQSVTFGGLTFTGGTGGASQDQVRAAFASIAGTSATTAQTFANANATANALVSDSIGRFTSGTAITGGTFAAAADNGKVSWTASAASNTQNTTSLTISSTGTVAVPTVSITTATNGSDGATQVQRIAFTDLKAGESIKLSGLTFTSGTAGTTKEQLKAIFVAFAATGNAADKTFAEANTAVGTTLTSDAIGRFTFGTHTVRGTYSSDTGSGEVKITAAAVNASMTLGASGTAAAPTATVNTATTPTSAFALGGSTAKSTETVTFQALNGGQSATVNGLTFTAKVNLTNAQVAAAFASVLTGETAAQVTTRNTASAGLGTYTGTNTAGYASTTVSSTNVVVYTSVNNAVASFGQPTSIATQGKAPLAQVSTATFTALEAGASVTFAGLTFTSGTDGTTADQLKAAFAKVAGTSATTAQTSTQANTTAGTDVSDAIGRFTSGTAITGGTFAAGSGTGQVTWTAGTTSDTQIALASTGSVESSVLTFSALKTGQSATINGLTFTAKKDLTSAEVATAFGSITSGSANPANTTSGDYTGSWTAGYSTAAASGATVTATATAAGTADIAFSNSKGAATLYGSVSLIADPAPKQPPPGAAPSNGAPPPYVSKTFKVEAGNNGFSSTGDFASLGFQAGTFGGDVSAADSKMTPPRTGRLSFHVGASANQTITIDLSDFGKNGPITGEITGDSDKSPATVHINDREAAKTVLAKLDRAMDKVNGTRATMGAVMNRLEHVIDNLTNVAMNSEASRSQIEDADYALASTELSRTQIMQQAATAVLAQANTSQQTVLKLLQ